MGVFSKLKGIFYDEVIVEDKDEEEVIALYLNVKSEIIFEKVKIVSE